MISLNPSENDLGPILEACPVCGSQESLSKTLVLQRSPHVNLRKCKKCGADSADRMPSSEFLSQIYDPEKYKGGLISHDELSARCARRIASHFQGKGNGGTVKILDFGGGDGTLGHCVSKELQSKFSGLETSVFVVDLFPPKDQLPVTFISADEFESSNEQFDIVIASAVIEHLTDVSGAMTKLLSAVKPGGLFYARTPFEAPIAKFVPKYRIRWPRHIHDLGPDFWSKVPQTFSENLDVLYSGPSFVETRLKDNFIRTTLAYLLKTPANIEMSLRPNYINSDPWWKIVGGWEYAAVKNS